MWLLTRVFGKSGRLRLSEKKNHQGKADDEYFVAEPSRSKHGCIQAIYPLAPNEDIGSDINSGVESSSKVVQRLQSLQCGTPSNKT